MLFKSRFCFAFIRKCADEEMVLVQTHKPHCTLLSTKTHNITAHLSGATGTQPHTEETTQCHIVQEKQVIVNTLNCMNQFTIYHTLNLIFHWRQNVSFSNHTNLKWGNVTLRSVLSRPSGIMSLRFLCLFCYGNFSVVLRDPSLVYTFQESLPL